MTLSDILQSQLHLLFTAPSSVNFYSQCKPYRHSLSQGLIELLFYCTFSHKYWVTLTGGTKISQYIPPLGSVWLHSCREWHLHWVRVSLCQLAIGAPMAWLLIWHCRYISFSVLFQTKSSLVWKSYTQKLRTIFQTNSSLARKEKNWFCKTQIPN